MTGFEPRTSGMEATALPTEPQPLPAALFVCCLSALHLTMKWERER